MGAKCVNEMEKMGMELERKNLVYGEIKETKINFYKIFFFISIFHIPP